MRCVVLVLCLAVPEFAVADEAADADIQGTWVAHDRNPWKDGEHAPSFVGRRLTFDRGKFTITDAKGQLLYRGDYQHEGAFRTELGQAAKAIRFVHTEGLARGQTWLGIYATCSSLRITDNSSDPSKPRPPGYHPKDKRGYASVGYSRTGRS